MENKTIRIKDVARKYAGGDKDKYDAFIAGATWQALKEYEDENKHPVQSDR